MRFFSDMADSTTGTTTRYFIETCPLADECTAASWHRTYNCQSYESEEDCKQKLLRHLRKSCHHWHRDEEELQAYVDMATVHTDEWDNAYFTAKDEKKKDTWSDWSEPPRKQRKMSAGQAANIATQAAEQALEKITATANVPNSTHIALEKKEMLRIIHMLKKACLAVNHAENICKQASAAFAEQHNSMEHTVLELQNIHEQS